MGLLKKFFNNRFTKKILEIEDTPERVARGVAVGSFIAVTPTVGFQIALAFAVATIARGNRLAAIAMTFVLNPFIVIPPSYWYFPAYYLGAFLLGAYQEILGDLHNLFGHTNAVHVRLDDDGQTTVEAVIHGDTVRQVLRYVQFDAEVLFGQLQGAVQRAIRAGCIDDHEAGRLLGFYKTGLEGYTYLEEAHER